MALSSAFYKLGPPARQQVLDDFQDGEGRSLHENLAVIGQVPPEYMAQLAYRDGADLESGLEPLEPHALLYDKPRCASLDGLTLLAATRASRLFGLGLGGVRFRDGPSQSRTEVGP